MNIFHMARHTAGTLMLSAGLAIERIAKIMGHNNISTTQVYAKVTDTKISEDMDRLMGRRNRTDSGETGNKIGRSETDR